jgi:hypothetical protein
MGLHKRVVKSDIVVNLPTNPSVDEAQQKTTEVEALAQSEPQPSSGLPPTAISTETRTERPRLPALAHELISMCFSGSVARRVSSYPKWAQAIAIIVAIFAATGMVASKVGEGFHDLGYGLEWLRKRKGGETKLKSPLDPSWKPRYEIKPAE